MDYSFDKRVAAKRNKSGLRQRMDVILKWEQSIFDPDDLELGENIIPKVSNVYWNALSKLYGKNSFLLLKFDGLHLDPLEVKSRVQKKDPEASLAIHFHNWVVKNYVEQDGYCIVKCSQSLYKFLFEHYWFSPGAECRLQGFVFEEKYAPQCFRWVRDGNCNSQRKYGEFLKKALIVFDNLHNGFHFRIETASKSLDLEKYVSGLR